jgi:HPt (histidine-containing phosphotransfer) domain-containing protein
MTNDTNIIDRAVVLQLVDDLSLPDLHRVVDTFGSDIHRLADALAVAATVGDAPAWKRHCHSIAGVASVFGAAPLESAARAAMERTEIVSADAIAEAAGIRALGSKALALLHAFLADQKGAG